MNCAVASTRWLRMRLRKLASALGMRCACNARRLASSSERKSLNAGLASFQVDRIHGSASAGAVYNVR